MDDLHQQTILDNYRHWLTLKAADLTADKELQKDLAQEGWIEMWKALKTFNEKRGSLPSWLTMKARGRMYDYLRTGGRTNRTGRGGATVAIPAPADKFEEIAETEQTFEEAYHKGEIWSAVDSLPKRQREYVRLRFYLGILPKEMVDYFGYEPNALWKYAKPVLKERLSHLDSSIGV
jgi:RNA polymerase sigma factor (sigma-70 family)